MALFVSFCVKDRDWERERESACRFHDFGEQIIPRTAGYKGL